MIQVAIAMPTHHHQPSCLRARQEGERELKMKVRIETNVAPAALKAFLEIAAVKLPVFFDDREHIVIDINPHNRADAILVIDWLMTQ